jgi:Rps23 Pro-64 3,4-dihydroxylase Tpa1-like proline 4-hydroxylase
MRKKTMSKKNKLRVNAGAADSDSTSIKKRKLDKPDNKLRKSSPKTVKLSSPLAPTIFSNTNRTQLRHFHDHSGPYRHVFIDGICETERMRLIHEEVKNNMSTTFKESDLFKLFQTVDLSNLDAASSNIPQLVSLRESIYSKEFRQFVTDITGCGDLTDRVDLSINAYTQGCHLLCHDDVISTRRISYIIYLADPDDDWQAEDGGLLELYPLQPGSEVDMGPNIGVQGIPTAAPTNFLVPRFNTMAFFVVQPGRSYHSVQEVFADKPRVSISGWYHGEAPPLGSDMASLGQIMSKGNDETPFQKIDYGSVISDGLAANKSKKISKGSIQGKKNKTHALTDADLENLHQLLNPEYLKKSVIREINNAFCNESSIQLKDFLRADIAEAMRVAMIRDDAALQLGDGARPANYDLGVGNGWELLGPPHKRRYLKYASTASSGGGEKNAIEASLESVSKLFQSASFARYLFAIISLRPLESTAEVRRFRPGLDYTVAHFGTMTDIPKLDATLCFVLSNGLMKHAANGSVPSDSVEVNADRGDANEDDTCESDEEPENEGEEVEEEEGGDEDDDDEDDDDDDDDDEEEDEEDDDRRDLWASGDVGGFECYIEADDESPDASEVYMTQVTANKQAAEEESSLLSVSAGFNMLNVVLRDQRVMRFVKYISAQAPSSRWDVSSQFVIDSSDSADDEEN